MEILAIVVTVILVVFSFRVIAAELVETGENDE